MLISVIITTYNWIESLNLALESLTKQSDNNFEILIADDGSTPDTAQAIAKFAISSSLPIKHIWHEDQGFRAGMIRNKAVAQAQGEYLVFLDGDCLVKSTFISNHRCLAEAGFFVAGNRVLLSPGFTADTLSLKQPIFQFSLWQWLHHRLSGHCNRFLPLIALPLGSIRKINPRKWQGAKTCNLGLFKKDFVDINGFDEAYVGWGFEDSDLIIRLLNLGIKRKSGRYSIPVLHLWHPENDRTNAAQNKERLEHLMQTNKTRTQSGIDQYL